MAFIIIFGALFVHTGTQTYVKRAHEPRKCTILTLCPEKIKSWILSAKRNPKSCVLLAKRSPSLGCTLHRVTQDLDLLLAERPKTWDFPGQRPPSLDFSLSIETSEINSGVFS